MRAQGMVSDGWGEAVGGCRDSAVIVISRDSGKRSFGNMIVTGTAKI